MMYISILSSNIYIYNRVHFNSLYIDYGLIKRPIPIKKTPSISQFIYLQTSNKVYILYIKKCSGKILAVKRQYLEVNKTVCCDIKMSSDSGAFDKFLKFFHFDKKCQ